MRGLENWKSSEQCKTYWKNKALDELETLINSKTFKEDQGSVTEENKGFLIIKISPACFLNTKAMP
jgi:hypothetical protein